MKQSLRAPSARVVRAVLAITVPTACGTVETNIEVFASTEDRHPIADIEVTVLPYDHERLLDSLTAAAATPRPTFAALERQFDSYRLPDAQALRSQDQEWQATRDSVRRLADSLNAAGRDARGYAPAYQRLGELYRRLTQQTAEREARWRDQIGPHRNLAAEAAAAADSIRAWERVAFADYPMLAELAALRTWREHHEVVTGANGIARVTLGPGRWWVTARLRDPDNPYQEYFWNIPLVAGRFGPRRVPLPLESAQRRWRH